MFVNRTSENFRNCNVERALIYIIATGEFDPQISVVFFYRACGPSVSFADMHSFMFNGQFSVISRAVELLLDVFETIRLGNLDGRESFHMCGRKKITLLDFCYLMTFLVTTFINFQVDCLH